MGEVDEVIQEFVLECNEILDALDNEFVTLEERGGDKELLASIFRNVHTIKGTCGFLEFSHMEAVSHVGEGLLSKMRDGQYEPTPDIVDALLSMGDALRAMLTTIESEGTDGDNDWAELVARLTVLRDTGTLDGYAAPTESGPKAEAAAESASAREPAPAPESASAREPAPAPESANAEAKPARSPADHAPGKRASDNIRVDVSLLDKLMNLVGELVLARNQILQFANDEWQEAGFVATSQRLNLITMELQEGVMKTRMQPINNIWGKFPRMIRHLASVCGKKVRIEMEGQDTELDRTILEAIKDPLTHIIRNSVDHGIEEPDARRRAGKSETGRLFLRAYHESGQVNMEITDDGGGIDAERVAAKAVDRGLVTQADVARMSHRELLNLIFLPGFSTAQAVTNVSGRGVGMDVVKTNIERIGGTVDIQSERGAGTTLRIKIPLTLAIIPTLIVVAAGERYAVPQVSLVELVRLEAEQAKVQIESIHGAPVYRLRGQLLPLVYLNETLELKGRTYRGSHFDTPDDAEHDGSMNIVVLQAYDRQFGLVVDEILDTAEIVVKPLGTQLKNLKVFAGATILGDGKVALILDVLGLAQESRVLSDNSHRGRSDQAKRDQRAGDLQQLLLFSLGGHRMAIPLSTISRLEEFPADALEQAGGHDVIQYRDTILPIVRLSSVLGLGGGAATGDVLQVLVYTEDGTHVGLVVDEILDVVEEAIVVRRRKRARAGLIGSAVISGKVTDLVDIPAVVEQAGVELFEDAPVAASA